MHQWYASATNGQFFVKFPVQEFMTAFAEMDLSLDGDVDSEDVALFVDCFTGPEIPYQLPAFPGGCTLSADADGTIPGDHDRDLDVDQEDFGVLQRCLGETVCPD
jgi:hypothetical protein